jgi:hypothetical protein
MISEKEVKRVQFPDFIDFAKSLSDLPHEEMAGMTDRINQSISDMSADDTAMIAHTVSVEVFLLHLRRL